jgi:hypothetical protein
MASGEILILGKLVLTFGVLIGLPLLDLWFLSRDDDDHGPGQ